MKYTVLITPTAETEIWEAFAYINRDAPVSAQHWLRAIYEGVEALELYPGRCPVAPESEHVGEELRHLVLGAYRVIFRMEEQAQVVRVIGVRHAARRAMGEPEPGDQEATS